MPDPTGEDRIHHQKGMPEGGPAQPGNRNEPAPDSHTPGGAPTDAAHQEAGDGSLTGSVPAGLTNAERGEKARDSGRDDAGAE
ncbi:MAG: hypothetical protein INR62_12500 [Rhodospirillales bacterium]|nr:hypothetical protein [Acetobacter sp.]